MAPTAASAPPSAAHTPSAPPAGADFFARTEALLGSLRAGGQYKTLQMLEGPMDATVHVKGYGECLCFCSNNYLGLANHPEVVAAGIEGLRKYGAGTASVRFICGTFEPHERLEETIARYMGTEASYTFVSCWNANEAVFPTVCEPGDIIISDELNHASIIDAIRLTTAIKKGVHKTVYKHNDVGALEAKLKEARANKEVTGAIWVVTDGVFSMEGDIADLPAMRRLCDQHNAVLVVDDSHGHGVMGKTGRGTHEHFNMCPPLAAHPTSDIRHPTSGTVDIFTGTLGKALGGGAGGFVAGPRSVTELLIQRGRPTLFSNALPVTVACSANKAIEILMREPQRVQKLRDNVASARTKIKQAGFNVLESSTAICPIIVHDTAKAIAMSKRLLELGVFVIGFGYPVVPEGHARLRVQISAAHTSQHIDALVAALKKLWGSLSNGVSSASVTIDGAVRAQIGRGLLVLAGLEETDTAETLAWAADKVANLRIFEDAGGKMNLSIRDVPGAAILLVPNFTVAGDARKGRRPSFDKAMRPERASIEFDRLAERLREQAGPTVPVETGVFRATMQVSLVNDGPVTIILESPDRATDRTTA